MGQQRQYFHYVKNLSSKDSPEKDKIPQLDFIQGFREDQQRKQEEKAQRRRLATIKTSNNNEKRLIERQTTVKLKFTDIDEETEASHSSKSNGKSGRKKDQFAEALVSGEELLRQIQQVCTEKFPKSDWRPLIATASSDAETSAMSKIRQTPTNRKTKFFYEARSSQPGNDLQHVAYASDLRPFATIDETKVQGQKKQRPSSSKVPKSFNTPMARLASPRGAQLVQRCSLSVNRTSRVQSANRQAGKDRYRMQRHEGPCLSSTISKTIVDSAAASDLDSQPCKDIFLCASPAPATHLSAMYKSLDAEMKTIFSKNREKFSLNRNSLKLNCK